MISDLMFGRATWSRRAATKDGSNAQTMGASTVVARDVPVNVQPATSQQKEEYLTRSLEISHVVYTTTVSGWKRNDVVTFNGRKLVVVGVRNLIELDRVVALDCLEYQGADLRG